MLWGGSRSTKPCVFPCKVAGAGDERYLVCAAVAAAVVPDAIGSSYEDCTLKVIRLYRLSLDIQKLKYLCWKLT